jgi:hypothetical protein
LRHKRLAVITTYLDLHEALRARCSELNISRETLDNVAGLQEGYSAKLLGPHPQGSMRVLGRQSLGLVLGALGVELIMVEKPGVIARLRERVMYGLQERDKSAVRQKDTKPDRMNGGNTAISRYFAALGAMGGKARLTKISKKRRKQIARDAINARWRKHRRQPHS